MWSLGDCNNIKKKIQFEKGVNLISYTAGFCGWRAGIELVILAGCSWFSTKTFHL